ncbi:MAG: hypothetical protein ACFFB3_05725 [Candidatus Hodarchaeota archaeon]
MEKKRNVCIKIRRRRFIISIGLEEDWIEGNAYEEIIEVLTALCEGKLGKFNLKKRINRLIKCIELDEEEPGIYPDHAWADYAEVV